LEKRGTSAWFRARKDTTIPMEEKTAPFRKRMKKESRLK
jgi:hypothetical protein